LTTYRYFKKDDTESLGLSRDISIDVFSKQILEIGNVNEALQKVFEDGVNSDTDTPVLGLKDMELRLLENRSSSLEGLGRVFTHLTLDERNELYSKSSSLKIPVPIIEDTFKYLQKTTSDKNVSFGSDVENEAANFNEALDVFVYLDKIDQLRASFKNAIAQGDLSQINLDAVEELVGQDAKKSLQQIIKMVAALEESGFLIKNRDRYKLSNSAVTQIAKDAMKEIFNQMKKNGLGNHDTFLKGEWGDLTGQTLPFEIAGNFDINLQKSLFNSVLRQGSGLPIRLNKDDLEINEYEHLSQSATVLLLDQSRSMGMYGTYTAAKKVSLALYWLIKTKFPKDKIFVVGFSDYAMLIEGKDLPESTWNHWVAGTNMHHGLIMARQLLSKQNVSNRQVLMVTDGEPTVHMQNGRAVFAHPPTKQTLDNTLMEVKKCTREGITINTFMLEINHFLMEFLDQMSKINKGRSFYTKPDELGRYLLVDYLSNRSGKFD